jgi:hypothetical protein
MFAVWSEPDQRVTVHAHSLASGVALIGNETTPSLPAAEAWLAGWGFLTAEPWEPVDGDPGRLTAPLTRKLTVVGGS